MKKNIIVMLVISFIISFSSFGDTMYSISVSGFDSEDEVKEAIEFIKMNNWEYSLESDKDLIIKLSPMNKDEISKVLYDLNKNNYSYLLESFEVEVKNQEENDDIDNEVNEEKSNMKSKEKKSSKQLSYEIGGFVKNFMFLNDITIKGNVGYHTHFFVIDENWKAINNPYLFLDMTYSTVYEELNSNVNIQVNGFPIVSLKLENDTNRITQKIDIPLKYLKEGFNRVEFITYHRISGNICDDNINPGNWITIKDNTFVNVEFLEKRDELNLSNYPYPYLNDKYEKGLEDYIFYIPRNTRDNILSAFGILSSGFGRYYEFNNIESNAVIIDDADSLGVRDKNIIFIGSYDEVNRYFPSILPYEKSFYDNNGIIYESISPYDIDKNLLIIASNNDRLIENGAMMLNSSDYVKQMDDYIQVISEEDRVIFENKEIDQKLRINQFGYEDILLKGVRRSSAGFLIDIPKNWELLRGSKFVLIDRNSDLLNLENSSITLSINGQPIGSRKMKGKDGIENMYEFDIPKNFLLLNQFNLVIEYSLDAGNRDCNDTGVDDTLWAIISNESYFDFKIKEKEFHSLRDYTTPFIKNFKFNDMTFVLPENIDEEYIRLVFDISSYLGKKINDFNGYKIVRDKNFSDLDYDSNLIVIGTPDNNSIVKDLNPNLYLKFNDTFTDYEDNDRIVLLDDYNNKVSSIQIIKSIYNSRKDILAVTSLIADNIDLTNEYLSNPDKVSLLNGEVMIIGSNNYSKSFNFNKDDSSLDEAPDISRIGTNENELLMLIVIMTTMIITLIVLIVVYSRKRRREQ